MGVSVGFRTCFGDWICGLGRIGDEGNMKRRGFLGLLGGAAVAGPGMAKEAITSNLSSLQLGTLASGAWDSGASVGVPQSLSDGPYDWAKDQLSKMLGRTVDQHLFHKRRMSVTSLDPDLASYRSMALHQKIRIQRERNYQRSLEYQHGYLEAHIAGWFD